MRHSLALENLTSTWPPKVILALAIAACLSAAFGISLGTSAKFVLEIYIKVLVFAFLVIVAMRGPRDLGYFIWSYVISVGILSYFSLFVFRLSARPGGGAYNLRLNDMYTYDSNDAGLIFVVGVPLTLLAYQTSGKRGKLASALILVGAAASLARGGSRGAFLGLVIVGLLLLVFATHVSLIKRLGVIVVITVALILAAPPGYWRQMETLASPTEDYNWTSSDARRAIWTRGLNYMWGRPVFGVGIGNFARAEGMISELARDAPAGTPIPWRSPHNSFVQVGAEVGIPGLILFSTLVMGCIIMPFLLRRRIPRGWQNGTTEQRLVYLGTVYIPIAMVGFAVCGFFLSFAYLDTVYLLAAYVSGLTISVNQLLLRPAAGGLPRSSARRPGRYSRHKRGESALMGTPHRRANCG
jgi:hypothetical protein